MFVTKITLPAASAELTAIPGCIVGWSFEDTTASSGSVFDLWDGSAASGQVQAQFTTNAGQSFRDFPDKHLFPFRNGLYFSLVSGTVVGQVTVLLDHECNDFHAYAVDIIAGNVNVVDLSALL